MKKKELIIFSIILVNLKVNNCDNNIPNNFVQQQPVNNYPIQDNKLNIQAAYNNQKYVSNNNNPLPETVQNNLAEISTTVTHWEKMIETLYLNIVGKGDKEQHISPIKNLISGSGQLIKDTINGTYNFIGDVAQKVQTIIPVSNWIKDIVRSTYLTDKDLKLKGVDAITNTIGDVFDKITEEVDVVLPGTRWCGWINKKDHSKGYGIFYLSDKCCKNHDMCQYVIESRESKYGLYNGGFFKRSHCDCDQEFYNCLKNTRSPLAREIGNTYFNVLKLQCFNEKHPAVCTRYGFSYFKKDKCLEYEFHINKPMKVQWFDQPDF